MALSTRLSITITPEIRPLQDTGHGRVSVGIEHTDYQRLSFVCISTQLRCLSCTVCH
jgi:hypothetical protein